MTIIAQLKAPGLSGKWAPKLATLFFCVFVSVFQPHTAKAQWVVSDPITETATSATAVSTAATFGATVANFILEFLELQKINGALGTLHSDIHLLVNANKKINVGSSQAVVDGIDRVDTQTNVEKIAADGTPAPTSHKFCNVFAAQVSGAAEDAARAQNNIVAQVGVQAGAGKGAPGQLGMQAQILNNRCPKGGNYCFEDAVNKAVNGQKKL